MCLLLQDSPERIDVTDEIRVFFHGGNIVDGVVKKMPGWFSNEWVVLGKNGLVYFKDYNSILLIEKKRIDENYTGD